MSLRRRPTVAGFTLIELMIVIVVLGVLTAIAYPSYLHYVYRTRRSDAYQALTQTQTSLERCYAQYFTYKPTAPAACPSIAATSPEGYYSITAPAISASSYALTATAIGPEAGDKECTSLSVDSSGRRTSTGTGSNCWNQ